MTSLPAFAVAVLLIAAVPGPAMALILRRAALRGFRHAIPTVLGLEAGLYVWALLAAGGVAALVEASELAFVVLRVVGAAILVVLGVRAWRAAWRARRSTVPVVHAGAAAEVADPVTQRRWWTAFAEGAVVQLANPKAAVFMIAFYPQFVAPGQPPLATTALLAFLQVAMETVFYLGLAAGVAGVGSWFRRPVIRRRLEAISGTALIALGLRVAITER
jgi:threonine/homoserine/homoserine lactone efflux protein